MENHIWWIFHILKYFN